MIAIALIIPNTYWSIQRGMIWGGPPATLSLLYNVVGAALAMAGWIHPLAAAVLMPLSSLTVITISLKARSFPRGT